MSPAALAIPVAFLGGALAAAGGAWYASRRYLRRVRVAERRARSAERMAEIGSMTGGLAHEIKNPLSTIGLNAQLLAEAIEDLGVPEEDRNRLLNRTRSLRREVDRLRGILTDFLEFAGQVHLTISPADANTLVEELVDFYLPEAQRQGVRLRADLAPGPVVVPLDSKAIKQALLNLMLNATQAMSAPPSSPSPPAGQAAAPGAARELILRTERGKEPDGRGIVCIHVIDTGPGIPDDILPRLFTPYFTTRSGGTGLGLPTARRLIEEHGGRIEVHSEVGRGSDFVISIPAGPDDTD